ncbi:hypothetical protein HDU67_001166 [Dinochytrium kinnereticum]|nr:hypothetical protein HDU67_001166 [Dinochytrium kinnereticum]
MTTTETTATASEHAFDVEAFVDCARYGELDDMRAMLDAYCAAAGADPADKDILRALVTRRSAGGHTALHVAAANGEVGVVQFLLPLYTKTDLTIGTTMDGSTPLHWAALNGKLECVELFLNAGADATLKNDDGRSAVTVAEQQNHLDVVNLLLKSFEPGEDITGGEAGAAAEALVNAVEEQMASVKLGEASV